MTKTILHSFLRHGVITGCRYYMYIRRYLLIVRPFGKSLSGRRAMWLVAINLVVSVLLATPVVHYTTLEVFADPDLGVRRMVLCVERWDSPTVRRAYSVFAFVIQFCLPLVVTATLYTRIYARLRLRRRRALSGRLIGSSAAVTNPFRRCPSSVGEPVTMERGRTSPLGVAGSNVASRTIRTNRILAAIVVNFIVCWLPWNVFGLITELDHYIVRGRHFELADLSLKGFAMASACINPLLYCWLNENLRRDLGSLSLRLNPFHRLSRQTRSLVGGGVSDFPGGAGHGDLPRFHIQPPSCPSNAAGTGTGGAAAVLPEASQSTAACCESLRRTSFLVISEPFSVSSIGSLAPSRHTSENKLKT